MKWLEAEEAFAIIKRLEDIPNHPLTEQEHEELSKIRFLELSKTQITVLPDFIGNLSQLESLYLSKTQITELPDSIGDLSHLKSLDLSNTQITVLPDFIGNLSNLESLALRKTQITELPDSIGDLSHLKSLDLSNTQITVLPDFIGNLSHLKSLDLSNTQITVLPGFIGNLSNLERLDLSNTQITVLPDFIGNLSQLESLYLSKTQITELPDSIGNLSHLKSLALSKTQITVLPDFIGNLSHLEWLALSNTQITVLPDFIGNLSHLEWLALRNTQITELLDSISNLSHLKGLDLSNTQITVLPDFIGNLSHLAWLDLSNTQITVLPDFIGNLSHLKSLYLSNTQIKALPDWLSQLSSLEQLDLSFCKLHHIPVSIIQMWLSQKIPFTDEKPASLHWFSTNFVNLYRTTLATQPVSLFFQSPELIQAYCDALKKRISDAKVIFLGHGEAGKTHTILRILSQGKHLVKGPELTDGIDIRTFATEYHDAAMSIRFWDFGGQEIMHSMHRCFLTGRCLYVVVVSNRDNSQPLTQKAEYWLRNIESFAKGCPVLLAVNKNDGNPNTAINTEGWHEKYHLIGQPIEYNARGTGKNIEHEAEEFQHLTEIICREAHKLDSVGMDFPETWYHIREELIKRGEQARYSGMKDSYFISKEEYRQICHDHGEHDPNIQKWLLEWFNDMGVCFSYHMDKATGKELEKYQILNPEWLTNAIYIIVNVGKFQADNGKLHENTIYLMLNNDEISKDNRVIKDHVEYGKEAVKSILQIMRKFNLSLPYEQNTGFEFIPGICGEKKPAGFDICHYSHTLCYEMDYVYLPENVVHQLMLRCGAFDQIYRRGFRLDLPHEQLSAVVDMGTSSSQLAIKIFYGDGVNPLNFINWLKGNLSEINQNMGFSPKEFVIAEQNGKRAKIPLRFVIEAQVDGDRWVKYSAIEDGSTLRFKTNELMGMVCSDQTIKAAELLAQNAQEKGGKSFEERMVQYMELMITQTQKIALSTGQINGNVENIRQNQLTAIEQQALCHQVMERLCQEQSHQYRELLCQMKKAGDKGALDVLGDFLSCTDSLVSIADSVLKPFIPKLLLTPVFAKLPAAVLAVLSIWGGAST